LCLCSQGHTTGSITWWLLPSRELVIFYPAFVNVEVKVLSLKISRILSANTTTSQVMSSDASSV
jgi:hypothetical protein